MSRFRTILATVLLATAAPLVHASTTDVLPLTRIVKFADLDLGQAEGAQKLYYRLSAAAKVVCEPYAGRRARDSRLHSA